MPGGDGTGPVGMGPMTGRAAGYCAGYPAPGFANPGFVGRWGHGRGRHGGHGWRRWYHATGLTGWQRAAGGYPAAWGPMPTGPAAASEPSREEQIDALQQQAEALRRTMDEVQRRIDELHSQGEAEYPDQQE
ncbi:MAG: DUF5320 domain-containing protein [Planctomycetota bacterium]